MPTFKPDVVITGAPHDIQAVFLTIIKTGIATPKIVEALNSVP